MKQQWNNQGQGNWPQQPQTPENLYVGTGKLIQGQYGRFIRLSFRAEDLQKMMQHLNADGWTTLILNQRQQPGANGATHSMKIDTWQPSPRQERARHQHGRPQPCVNQQPDNGGFGITAQGFSDEEYESENNIPF